MKQSDKFITGIADVLVIDANVHNLRRCCHMLGAVEGLRVRPFKGVNEAIAACRKIMPDVILLGPMSSLNDIRESVQRIRQLTFELHYAPILYLDDGKQAFHQIQEGDIDSSSMGCDLIVSFPKEAADFCQIITRVLFAMGWDESNLQGLLKKTESSNLLMEEHSPLALPGDSLSQLNTLVVEDNPVNLMLINKMLQFFKIVPVTAVNGEEAAHRFKNALYNPDFKPFDVILMDINMPVCNGIEAARRIRKIEQSYAPTRSVVIYALSAQIAEDSLEQVVRAGMDGFIAKPVEIADLQNRLFSVANVKQGNLQSTANAIPSLSPKLQ